MRPQSPDTQYTNNSNVNKNSNDFPLEYQCKILNKILANGIQEYITKIMKNQALSQSLEDGPAHENQSI